MIYSACLTLLVIGAYSNRLHTFRDVADASSYISMAQGEKEGVRLHHAKRVLHPFLVRGLSQFCTIHTAFYLVGGLSLFGFLVTGCQILNGKIGLPLYYALPLMCTPFLLDAVETLYLPGILFLFLLALYFMFLLDGKHLACVFTLLALCFTRDECIVLVVATLGVLAHGARVSGCDRRTAVFGSGVIAAAVTAAVCLRIITGANANMHGIPGFIFSLGRMPLFLMRNLTGFSHWVDNYAQLASYPNAPLFKMAAPAWLQSISAIKECGIYAWTGSSVLSFWLLVMTSFGTLPAMAAYGAWRSRRWPPPPSQAHAVAAVFGAIIFLIFPALGPASLRYIATAWPLFFIFVGARLYGLQKTHPTAAAGVVLCSVTCSWLRCDHVRDYVHAGILLLLALVLHSCTWYMISRSRAVTRPR